VWGSSISLITAGSMHFLKKGFRIKERKKERKQARKRKGRNGMEWNGSQGLGFTIWALPNLGIPQFWRVVFVFRSAPSAPKIT